MSRRVGVIFAALPPFVLEFEEHQAGEFLVAFGGAGVLPHRAERLRYIFDAMATEAGYPGFRFDR